jgi:aminobenzoyl-glutamate transport protein
MSSKVNKPVSVTPPKTSSQPGDKEKSKGFLGLVEELGNKLPHPFWIFVGLCGLIVVTSMVTAWIGLSAVNPTSGEKVEVVNLMSAAGLQRFLEEMVTNFSHFEPVGLVLVMLMGVSIAEKSGLLAAIMRSIAFKVPKIIVFPVIFILAACGNIGSDAGVVIIPPIAAIVFANLGYHPVAGLVVGYAGATAGFTANFFIAGTDVLLAGLSSQVTHNISEGLAVSATANWYFMIASTVVLAIGGTLIAKKFTIPQTKDFARSEELLDDPQEETSRQVSDLERKGMRWAGVAALVMLGILLLCLVPENGILREPETGTIVPSPFLRGLIPILFVFFAITGYVYGKVVGTIKKPDDALKFMEQGLKGLTGYIVLMLIVAQFIELFQWSRLDTILAISGASFLKTSGLMGLPLFILFIVIVAFVNIFMGSGSAKWAIFAPIFIPMLYQLDYSPAFVQLLYRIGDSITNGISPLYPYFPFLLGLIKKHDKKAGIGTVVSLLIPYSGILLVIWIVMLFIWVTFNIPIGVGETIYMGN